MYSDTKRGLVIAFQLTVFPFYLGQHLPRTPGWLGFGILLMLISMVITIRDSAAHIRRWWVNR